MLKGALIATAGAFAVAVVATVATAPAAIAQSKCCLKHIPLTLHVPGVRADAAGAAARKVLQP
jgi:hypothetical protein